MKIISGKYKGRKIQGFDIIGTRPTMDRVKESIFGMIQNYVNEATVLDLYAGSGNLGIEALSNGASKAYFNDINKESIKIIKNNINMLKADNTIIINQDATKTLNDLLKQKVIFDIIFVDPPYNTDEIAKTLCFINNNLSILSDNGIIVCETELQIPYEKFKNLNIIKSRSYGKKNVNILKKCQNEN